MSLLFQCERFAVFEPESDSEALALENMQPDKDIYYLQFNHAMFQSVCWYERMIMICSNNELQIVPPKIPHKKCLLEVIGKLQSNIDNIDTSIFEYSADELEVFAELPNGWKLSDLQQFIGYRSQPLPQINYEMERLQWYLGAPLPIEANDTLFIHPECDRPLTHLEWSAIVSTSGDTALAAWLGWLESLPSPALPHGANLERRERIRAVLDLRPLGTFPALAVYPYPNPRKPARLFNVNNDGTLRVAWNLISRCNQGMITYENITRTIESDSESTIETANDIS